MTHPYHNAGTEFSADRAAFERLLLAQLQKGWGDEVAEVRVAASPARYLSLLDLRIVATPRVLAYLGDSGFEHKRIPKGSSLYENEFHHDYALPILEEHAGLFNVTRAVVEGNEVIITAERMRYPYGHR